ncbi:WxL protein peptidoglycan domain-containing protein [Nakamurella leprariae]|uniref:WxL protein peptidoglycan domain-containing protein n=1 Tax=Nakamurella leprariae TaxID=2803911 RepID=UPI0038B3E986
MTWGVRPSTPEGPDGRDTFRYTLDPGASVEDYVGVSNFTDQPLELAVYASDAFTTGEGGFDLLAAADEPVDAGSWVDFGQETVTVPPRSRLEVPFRLTVPDNATPGDHTGGVVASLTSTTTAADGSQVAVDRRVGARIYLWVTGDALPSATVTDVQLVHHGTLNPFGSGDATVSWTVRNTGNIRLAGTPTVEVAGPFGLGRRTVDAEPVTELLPGNSLTMTTEVDAVWPWGWLTGTVRFAPQSIGLDGAPPPAEAVGEDTTAAVPWTQLLLLALLVLAGWLWRRSGIRRGRVRIEELAAARAEGAEAGREAALQGRGSQTGGADQQVEPADDRPTP